MARIFRALLIAAVNAIQEFFAFATDNGESQVGDSVKLNDGMATSNYDWSAYPSDTEITGDYTQTGTIEKVKQIGNDFAYGMQEPEQDNKDVTINTGEIYYGWTDGTNTYYTTTEDISNNSHLYDSNFNDITSQHTIEATSEILIDGNLVTSTSSIVKDITSDIEIIDNTTIQTVTITSDQTAEIETSTSVTTSNNDNVVSGTDWHIFNLTTPQNITTYIQSGGIEFTPLNMPLLLKKDVGVGLLLKNGNNAQYRNHWVINRDYDLHYQELQFSTNVSDPTILVDINNVNTNSPYYFYNGDTYKYKISKEGYCDYEGSGTTTYTSADGKITTVEVELAVSNGTVNVTDYEYTLNNTGNMVLTKYIGSSTDVTVPNI